MNRREWMRLSGAALAALASERAAASARTAMSENRGEKLREAKDAFDHLLLGVADLDSGVRWVEKRTGVRAVLGGNHPGRGTRNALLSLGAGHYLEIIAPDPAQPDAPDERGLRQLASPRLIQWAIHTDNILAAKRTAEAAGVKVTGPQPGSRRRPDGTMLRWQTIGIEENTPLAPFFIEWAAGSAHPSGDAPKAGTVKALRFETPQAQELRRVLHGAGVEADIREAQAARIVAMLHTGRGEVEIS